MRISPRGKRRRGIAATEMALISPLLLTLLLGVWEVCRYIETLGLVQNAAREGGRISASAAYFASTNHADPTGGTLTLSNPSSNSDYEVQQMVKLYLNAAGINTTNLSVQVSNSGSSTNPKSWSYTWVNGGSNSGSGYDPAAAADQLDTLTITVSIPYTNVAWSPLSTFVSQTSTVTATSTWSSLRDIPLTVSTSIPSKILTASDPLP